MAGGSGGDRTRPGGFDLASLASTAQPREVTGHTFSYVDAMLTGRMSEADLARIREDLLGDAQALAPAPAPARPAPQPPPQVDLAMSRIEGLIASRDHAGALRDCEMLLERDPSHARASQAAEHCRQHLAELYLSHLGTGFDIPKLAVPTESLGAYGVDRWAAYLISRFDDHVTIDDLVHLTNFTRLDTFRLLYDLVHRRLVVIERMTPPPPAPPSAPRADATSTGGAVLARVKLKSILG